MSSDRAAGRPPAGSDPGVLSTAEALARGLLFHGVDTVFALPGVQNDPLFDAFHAVGNRLRVVHTRHEQGTAYMALGWAQASGRPSAFCVVPGPGVLNTTAALATALAANAPVLCLAGQIPQPLIGRRTGQLHELPDQLGVLRLLTKDAARIGHPSAVPGALSRAFSLMASGRPGPVALEAPTDVLRHAAPVGPDRAAERERPTAEPAAVEAAAAVLSRAERPLLYIGGGAMEAGAALLALARRLGAPIVYNQSGKGAVPDGDPSVAPVTVGQDLWAEADAVLAVGTRLASPLLHWGAAGLSIVRIDIDPEEPARIAAPAAALVGDAAETAAALLDALGPGDRLPWTDTAARKRASAEAAAGRVGPQMAWLAAIRRALPAESVLVEDTTQVAYCARFAFPVEQPRTYLSYGYQGTLGFAYPTALGAQMAVPGRRAVALCGDGGFMFNVQELSTAVQNRIPAIVIVFNDGRFGNVHRIQAESFGGRHIAVDLANPDFLRLAASFGCRAARADTPEALERALRDGLDRDEPLLIEVPVGEMPSPWPVLRRGRLRGA